MVSEWSARAAAAHESDGDDDEHDEHDDNQDCLHVAHVPRRVEFMQCRWPGVRSELPTLAVAMQPRPAGGRVHSLAAYTPHWYSSDMTTSATYQVSGMTCAHCVRAVSDELSALDGVSHVDVSLVAGGVSSVRVDSERPLGDAEVTAAVDEAGYALVSS